MEIVDAQLHAWDDDSSSYPWDRAWIASLPPHLRSRFDTRLTAENLMHMMLAVGVDAAVLTSPMLYGSDHRYTLDAVAHHPTQFGAVGPLGPETPNVEERVRTYREQPGGLGVRVFALPGKTESLDSAGHRRIFAAAEQADVPVFLLAVGLLKAIPDIARAYPNLQLIIDHLGTATLDKNADRLAVLPDLLALAQFDNVAVKCTDVPSLSKEPYPFSDLWPHLHRILESFGPERLMWGTDITVHRGELTYCEAVDYMRRTDQLSESEKELVLGKNVRRILRWPRPTQTG